MVKSDYSQKEVNYRGFNVVMHENDYLDEPTIKLLDSVILFCERNSKIIRVVFFNYKAGSFIGFSVYFGKKK